jgi:V8-like Glu-specific endopeptidase
VRRAATLAAVVALGGSLFAAPPASAASGAAAGPIAGSGAAISYWTAARRRAAEPLSLLTLPGSAGRAGSAATPLAATGAIQDLAEPTTVEGEDTGDPTLFPNRANGKIYGVYEIQSGHKILVEEYECSGSVIDSVAGDVVLTAGHCVIDPKTGTVAQEVVFVPGYREGAAPYGRWAATAYATTEEWADTAGTEDPDEAGDLAVLVLAENAGKDVEEAVGGLGISFEQTQAQTEDQTYTQYGYPAKEPYDGEILYSNTTAYAGSDHNFSPATIKIASDFTAGSSGGPWTIGPSSSPTVVSLTDYVYEHSPGFIYGAYLGKAARVVFDEVNVARSPAGEVGTGSSPPATESPPAGDSGSGAQASPAAAAPSLRIVGIRHQPTSGSATLLVAVNGAGTLTLGGHGVRSAERSAPAAGTYGIAVRASGASRSVLSRRGSLPLKVRVTFSTGSGSRQVMRLVRLRLS